MFSFLLTLAVIAGWIYALAISSRLRSARQQHEEELSGLVWRVRLLEDAAEAGRQPPAPKPMLAEPATAITAAPEPSIQPEQPPEREPAYAPADSYASRLDHLIGGGLPEPVPAPVASVSEPLFQESIPVEPVLQESRGQGWEAALGGSWLNKIGVLLVVVGLVLFIRYSFGMLGPAGRVAVSLTVSASMLMAGAVLERREKYRVAARGLIGGGWAGLYATTFAAHAIEAARVIENPTLATLLLAAVALGMVLHSLRYRSQTVTGVAYFVAFVTLAITQLTVFAVVALVPLAASLLYLAHRFRWTAMALAGLPATYGIYMLHAARSSGGSLALGQTVLLVYWLVFEGFEVFDSMRRRTEGGNPSAVFPLNAICFTAVSAMQWAAVSQSTLYQFFELAAAAYLGSTLVRALLLPPSGFPAECSVLDRARRGGYEGAVTLSATFAAVAVALKLSGLSLAVGLMAEAELLFLAGHLLRQAHLRHLAAALFGVANLRLIAFDVAGGRQITVAGSPWYAWSPVALLEAAVFYLNRFVCHRGAFYSSFAAGLLTLVLGFEMPPAYLGPAWVLLAVALYELGLAARLREFVVQGYFVGIASLFALGLNNVLGTGRHTDWYGWLPQLCGAVLLYAFATRVGIFPKRDADSSERGMVCHVAAMAGTVLAATFLLNVLETGFVGLAWLLLAVALYEFSLVARLQQFAVQACLAGLASLLMLVAQNVVATGLHTGWHGWLPQLAAAAVLYGIAARSRILRGRHWSETGQEVLSDLPALIGTVLAAAFLANTLPNAARAIGWAVLGLVLLVIGTRLGNFALRMQSYALAVIAFGWAWSFNLSVEGQVAGLPLSIVTAVAVIASFYAAELLAPRAPANMAPGEGLQGFEAYARFLFSWLGTLLLAALLFHEVSDKMRTVAWGIQGLGLLFAGFPLRERPMRFAGLLLLLVCVLKLFVWDLRNLDMPFRVLSFIVLGLILIGVSFFYSRFRERISRYM